MFHRREILAALTLAAFARPAIAKSGDHRDRALDAAFREHAPPALAAAIVTREGLEWSGVRGVRRFGANDQAALDDVWHLGSCTKAMTAALYGRLVEQGRAQWRSTIQELFPDIAVHPGWTSATISSLLMHRAGMSDGSWLTDDWLRMAQRDKTDLRKQRRDLVTRVVERPPAHQAGSLEYSNLDYIIVGAAIEAIAAESWETVMRRELFAPLGIKSGGFGAAHGRVPWPHRNTDTIPLPIDPDRSDSDNPAVIGPAGTVHMSLQDYARFVRMILKEGDGFLSRETVQTLTTPFGSESPDYALGWVVVRDRPWAKGIMLGHEGTNTLNHAYCAIAPAIGKAVIAFSNDGMRGAMATVAVARSLAATLT